MDDTKIEHYEPVDMRDTYYDIEVEYHSIKASHLHNQEETEQLKESLITLYENGVFKNPFV